MAKARVIMAKARVWKKFFFYTSPRTIKLSKCTCPKRLIHGHHYQAYGPSVSVFAHFKLFFYKFTHRSSRCGDMNYVIYDTERPHEGLYGCIRGLTWAHIRADIGSCERANMGLESRAVSARVTKHFVTFFSKTCNNCPLKRKLILTVQKPRIDYI